MLPLQQILADLVRLPSVNPMGRTDLPADILYEARVTAYLEAKLRELGAAPRRQPVSPGRDNLIAVYEPPAPPPFTVLFEAHQDTVPVDAMTVEPFAATVEGGRMYGRGACDVKAGGVAMLTAFARLVTEKPAGSAAVTLAFTVDEEHTFLGVQHLMATGVRADCAIVAEPTELNIVKAHKGVVRWAIDTPGVACHSSRPEDGVNAVYRMARLLRGLEEYAGQLRASRTDPLLGPPTFSVGMIQGGVSPNTVPDKCRIEIDRRLLPGEDPTAVVDEVDTFLRAYPGIDFPYTIVRKLACPALPATGTEDLVRRLGGAIDAVVGRHDVTVVPFGTDASSIAAAGVPSVVFGPGNIAQAHTKDEWVELQPVEQAADILFRFASGA